MINGMKIGMSTSTDESFLIPGALEEAAGAGIEVIELSYNPFEKIKEIGVVSFSEKVKKAGMELWSVHVPFHHHVDIASPIEEERQKDMVRIKDLMDDIAASSAKHVIIHPGLEVEYDCPREVRIDACKRSLYELTEYADKLGLILCVEDLPRDCIGNTIAEMKEIMTAHPHLKIVFDTNHLLRDDPVDFIHEFGDKIETLHVSDYDFTDEKHWLPGEGDIDWKSVIEALRAAGYKGPWMYELSRKGKRGTPRERDLTFKDFYENADALLNGKEPPAIKAV